MRHPARCPPRRAALGVLTLLTLVASAAASSWPGGDLGNFPSCIRTPLSAAAAATTPAPATRPGCAWLRALDRRGCGAVAIWNWEYWLRQGCPLALKPSDPFASPTDQSKKGPGWGSVSARGCCRDALNNFSARVPGAPKQTTLRLGFGPYSPVPLVRYDKEADPVFSGFMYDQTEAFAEHMGLGFELGDFALSHDTFGLSSKHFEYYNSDAYWDNEAAPVHGFWMNLFEPRYSYKPSHSEHVVFSAAAHRGHVVGYVYQYRVEDSIFRMFQPFAADLWCVEKSGGMTRVWVIS